MPIKTDRELVVAYVEAGDESSFSELVVRHTQMVYRTCFRMLGNIHDTQDATQAVFIVLARKAGTLQREGNLGGWLHKVARNVALQALERRTTSATREKEVTMWHETVSDEAGLDSHAEVALQLLDQELAGLSAVLRQAVVLRYLQGNSEKQAAELAACPQGTLSRRASDGIAKLRQRLAKRGVALSGVTLAGLLTSEASAAVPETLLPSILATVKTAVATTATATAALPGVALGAKTGTTTAAMLAKGAMKAMFIAKVKTAALVTAASLVVAGSGAIVAQEVAQRKAAVSPAVNIDLITVKSLTVAQAEAIVKRQESNPVTMAEVEADAMRAAGEAVAALRAIGATQEQIERFRAEMNSDKHGRTSLLGFFSRRSSPEWQRLGNGFRDMLMLPALTSLSPEVAAALAKAKLGDGNLSGHLWLDGLATLTPEVARALANFSGDLSLPGLTSLTPDTAAALANCRGYCLRLPGLTTLTPEAAAAIMSRNRYLDLSVVKTLTPEVAKAMQHRKCPLDLSGLTTLTPDVAEWLAYPDCYLILRGITALTSETAEALTKHECRALYLGLTTITPDVAASLGKLHFLELGQLTTLSPSVAEVLATCKAKVVLPPDMKLSKP